MAGSMTIAAISATLILALTSGTLLNLSRNPHWFIRGWDFPRMQILALTAASLFAYLSARELPLLRDLDDWRAWDWVVTLSAISISLWHISHIWAYTPLARKQVIGTEKRVDGQSICVVVSNVEMENEDIDGWSRTMMAAKPDVLIAVEVNDLWMQRTKDLRRQFEHEIAQPQENWYGMMLLSHFPVSDVSVRFLVQDDVPSIHATVQLPSGQSVRIIAVHPRPPEPIRDVDATHRNAELVLIAKDHASEGPVIVGGDLNDVAWSATTRLFLRLSKLLDPRRGRGFFNTFHAEHVWFRFPLDHIFHSSHFTLRRIERLPYVGSDHFPILLELQFEPEKMVEQPVMQKDEADEEFAEEILETESEQESSETSKV
jgi:endonuclease/exonuclease/phosphatase (EEP) superfamily protein YafD